MSHPMNGDAGWDNMPYMVDQRTIDIAISGEFYQHSEDNVDLEWLQKYYNPKR